MGFKDWLQLFRAQTAPATVLSILLPYLFAGGRDPLMVTIIIILGTLTHYASFGHNSVMDYFFDVHDPNKRHHPLESGRIPLGKAVIVVNSMMIALALAWVIVSIELAPSPVMSLMLLILYIVFGQAYNDWTDKLDVNSYIYIVGCFAALTAFGWSLASATLNIIGYLIVMFAGFTICYQIAWEGNLKDLWNPKEKNLLTVLGFRVIDGKITGPKYVNYSFMTIRLGVNTVVLALVGVLLGSVSALVSLSLVTVFEAYAVGKMHLELSKYSRDKLLELMGLSEAVEFFRLTMLLPLYLSVPIVAISILYFACMNHVLWESRFGPKV